MAGVLALLAAACGGSPVTGPPSTGEVATPLCRLQASAGSAPIDEVVTVFWDGTHQALHDLAAEVEGVDRGTAAELLRAKAQVEELLGTTGSTDPRRLSEAVARLVEATAAGREQLGREAVRC